MKTTTGHSHTRWPVLLCALLACAAAHAQVYRVVNPDGSVSFTDRPPAVTNKQSTRVEALNIPGASGATDVDASSLPEELKQAVSRFPVTIYTDKGCAPCDTGRAFLTSRGIPFSERTLSSAAAAEKLREMTGGTSLPVLGIGAQKLIGYTESEWTRYLDAAGYPKTSQLPATYSQPSAKPLVEEPAAQSDDAPAAETGSAEDAPQDDDATP